MQASFDNFIFDQRSQVQNFRGGGIVSSLFYRDDVNSVQLHQFLICTHRKKKKKCRSDIKKLYQRWHAFYCLQEERELIKKLFGFFDMQNQKTSAYRDVLFEMICFLIKHCYGYHLLEEEQDFLKIILSKYFKQQACILHCFICVHPDLYQKYVNYAKKSVYSSFFKVQKHLLSPQKIKLNFLNKTFFLQESTFWDMTHLLDSA